MNNRLIATILLLLAPTFALAASGDTVIGRIILADGKVEALSPSGSSRLLSRRDRVLEGETLRTSDSSLAQIRMVDNGVLSMAANSELAFRRFEYDGRGGAADRAIYYLRRGGFRTITGAIGNGKDDEYRMETDYGTVETRGTTFSCVIEGGLYCGVYDGALALSNAGTSLDLGIGSSYDYAVVPGPGAEPQPLLQAPSPLQLNNVSGARATPAPRNPPPPPSSSTGSSFPAPAPIRVTPVRQ